MVISSLPELRLPVSERRRTQRTDGRRMWGQGFGELPPTTKTAQLLQLTGGYNFVVPNPVF